MLFAIPRLQKAVTPMPPGSHWITISHAAHPSSPLAGRHLLIDSTGIIIGGAIPSEFYGKTLAEVHMTGAAATDHPLHEALKKAADETQHPLSDAQVDTLAEAFHAHPSDGTHARFRTVMKALEKMGFKRSDAKRLTAQTANALVKAKHLHSRDINAWSNADTGVLARAVTPTIMVNPDAAKTVMHRTIMKSLKSLSYNDGTITDSGMINMDKILAVARAEHKGPDEYTINGLALTLNLNGSISRFGAVVGDGVVSGVFDPSVAKHAVAAAITALDTIVPESMAKARNWIRRYGFKRFVGRYGGFANFDKGLRMAFGEDTVKVFNKDPLGYFPELVEKIFRARRDSSHLDTLEERAVSYVAEAMIKAIDEVSDGISGLSYFASDTPWEVVGLRNFIVRMLLTKDALSSPLLYGALAIGDVSETFDPREVSKAGAIEIFLEALQKAFPKMSATAMMREFRGGEIGKKDRPEQFNEFDKAIQDTFADFPFYQNCTDVLQKSFNDKDLVRAVKMRMASRELMYGHLLVTDDAESWWMKKIEQRTEKFMVKSDPIGGRRTLSKASPQETAEIEKLIAGSVNSHHKRKPVAKAVYKLDYDHPEFDALAKEYGNVQRLFHGTKNEVVGFCMVSGLKVPGKEVPTATGSMFGRGIYFADQSTKSGLYCTDGDDAVLFVCDVALGNEKILTNADTMLSPDTIKDKRRQVFEVNDPEKTRDFLKDIEAENILLSYASTIMAKNGLFKVPPSPVTPEQQKLLGLVDEMLEKASSGKSRDIEAALKDFANESERVDDSKKYSTEANNRLLKIELNTRQVDGLSGKSGAKPRTLSELLKQEVNKTSRTRGKFVRTLKNTLEEMNPRSDSPTAENILNAVKRFESRITRKDNESVPGAFSVKKVPVQSVHGVPSDALNNNEWVVYDEDQVQMRYAVHVSMERNRD